MIRINDAKSFYSKVSLECEEAKNKLSNVDKIESEILHYIEIGSYNAAQGSQLIKKLKEVRQVRRGYKAEYEEIRLIRDRLSKGDIDKLTYSPAKCVARPIGNILNAKL